MSERTIGFSIEIKGTESEVGKLADLKRELIDAEKKVKDLAATTKGNIGAQKASATQMAELELKVKSLKKEYVEQQKAITNTTIANTAAVGSNEQLRAQLSLSTLQYNKLSQEERENSVRGIDLMKTVASLTATLKVNEGAVGDNRRNVGNYAGALKDLKDSLKEAQSEMVRIASVSGTDSKEFHAAAKQAGFFKDQIDDVKAATKQMATGSGLGQFKNQLKGVGESLMDLDFKEAAERAKLLGITAQGLTFSGLISGAKNAAIAMYEMAAAFLATPFGMVAAAIGVATGALTLFVKASHDSTAEVIGGIDKMAKRYEALFDAKIQLAKAYGRNTDKLELEKLDEEKFHIERRIKVLEKQSATITGLNEDEEKKLAELRELKLKNIVNTLSKEGEIKTKALEKQTKDSEKEKADLDKHAEDLKAITIKNNSDIEAEKKANAAKILQLTAEIAKGNVEALEAGYVKEKAAIDNKYDAEIKILEASIIIKKKLRADEIELNKLTNDKIFQLIGENKKAVTKLEEDTTIKRNEVALKHNNFLSLMEIEGVKQSKGTAEEKGKAILEIQKKYAQQEIDLLEASSNAQTDEVRLRIAQLKSLIASEGKPAPGESLTEQLFGTNAKLAEQAIAGVLTIAKQASDAVFQAEQESNQRALSQKISQLSDIHNTEVMGLQARLQAGAITQAQFDIEKKIADDKFRAEELKAKKEAFEEDKRIKKTQIGINLAMQLANIALAASGNPANAVTYGAAGLAQYAIQAAIAIAGAAIQVGAINSQKFSKGGLLEGNSHSDGGIPFTINGRAGFEAEGGETIINKRSSAMYGDLLSRINVAGGGVPFQRSFAFGGPLPSVNTSTPKSRAMDLNLSELAQTIVNGINSKPVTLLMSDLKETQNKLDIIDKESTF